MKKLFFIAFFGLFISQNQYAQGPFSDILKELKDFIIKEQNTLNEIDQDLYELYKGLEDIKEQKLQLSSKTNLNIHESLAILGLDMEKGINIISTEIKIIEKEDTEDSLKWTKKVYSIVLASRIISKNWFTW